MTQAAQVQSRAAARSRILTEAARLLDTGGLDAMSTRAVASAAQVSTPVIYREFVDKDGLVSAVIDSVLAEYWADKQRVTYATDDPLEDLRQLFNLHIQFGLAHPYCYAIAYVAVPDHAGIARLLSQSPFLLQVMQRIAAQGRLRVSAEDAAHLMATAGIGSVLTLTATAERQRDLSLAQLAREAVLSVILADGHEARIPVATRPKVSAIALREALRAQPGPEMSPGEAMLIDEWLQRLAECDSELNIKPSKMVIANESPMSSTAQRILQAAADLMRSGGSQAVSTRSVAAAAGVQPPDLYRLFGDKDGLVAQTVAEVQREYLHCKRRTLRATDDPMLNFRKLWETHVEFGLANPEVYVLGYARTRSAVASLARSEMSTLFEQRLAALGRHGRLGLSVDRATAVAVLLVIGATTMQIPLAKRSRDLRLTQMACRSAEAAFAAEESAPAVSTAEHADILRDALKGARDVPLSGAERGLLNEWLQRLARPFG